MIYHSFAAPGCIRERDFRNPTTFDWSIGVGRAGTCSVGYLPFAARAALHSKVLIAENRIETQNADTVHFVYPTQLTRLARDHERCERPHAGWLRRSCVVVGSLSARKDVCRLRIEVGVGAQRIKQISRAGLYASGFCAADLPFVSTDFLDLHLVERHLVTGGKGAHDRSGLTPEGRANHRALETDQRIANLAFAPLRGA